MSNTTINAAVFQMFDSIKAFNNLIEQPMKLKVSQKLMKVAEAINTIITQKREELGKIESNTELSEEARKEAIIEILNARFDLGEAPFSQDDFASIEISPKELQTISFLIG